MYPIVNKVAFTIFGFPIMWYGILIGIGFYCGIYSALFLGKKEGIKEDSILDLVLWIIPSSIIGARLYYVIFSWDYYKGNPWKMLDIREGGLAIYGGLIAAFLVSYFICKKKSISFVKMADIFAPGIALGQAIGRWGNYINQEAYGTPTNLPWGIMVDGVKVHPTFLYESIGDFIIFGILFYFFINKKKYTGQVISLYMILYGLLRFFVEGMRTDSLYLGPIRISQLVSLILIAVGGFIYGYITKPRQEGQ